jgi:RNA polymerase sigma-70 factor (ECF subfamily)
LETELIDRAAAGDRRAQSALLEACHGQVQHMLFRLVGAVPDLDDLRQTVLLLVLQRLPSFRRETAVGTWIGGICVNVARRYLREKRRQAQRLGGLHCEQYDPTATLECRQRLAQAQVVLSTLSPEQRICFVLKTHGHSVEEIAALTGAARSTTRLRLYWGRKKFFKGMQGGLAPHPEGASPSPERRADHG